MSAAWRPPRWIAPAIGAWGAAVVAVVAVRGLPEALARMDHYEGFLVDFSIYHDQARRLLQPVPSLGEHWAYPPALAIVFLGFGALEYPAASALWLAVQLLLVALLALACAESLARLARPSRWVCAAGLTVSSLPIAHGLKWGQVSVLVLLLAVHGMSRSGWKAAWLLGMAVAAKMYPAAYALAHLLRRDWRALVRLGVASVAIGVLLPVAALGPTAAGILSGRALATTHSLLGSPPAAASQNLAALVDKYFELGHFGGAPRALLFPLSPGARALLAVLLACAVVGVSAWRVRKLPATHAVTVTSTILSFALVLSPAWAHYFSVLPLAQAVVLDRARGTVPVGLFCASFLLGALPVVAYLVNPLLFYVAQSFGMVTLSALACLVGLWLVAGEPERDG